MRERSVISGSLPSQLTTFIGRQSEIGELLGMLANPDCRLVSVVGPGGIGKTRLALEVTAQFSSTPADGVAFVPLQSLTTTDLLATAIATTIGCPLSGENDMLVQLLNYLREKHLLLVLDNFEHLTDGASLLAELLAATPGVRLLVTSREALNLQEEWRFPLSGLAIPTDALSDNVACCEAEQLFVERARRARPDFMLAAERAGIARICQLVDGLPLALELAAVWTKTLPCAVIADEIARNLALLTSPLRNVLDRHRSMRAAFDHSWMLLSEAERDVFMRLAVFRGGFEREAAETVAGATLPLLAALGDKSLLRYEADGRYRLHELLRQYAEERLGAAPHTWDDTCDKHCVYYLALLAAQFDAFSGANQRAAVRAIATELENFRTAWQRALDRGFFAALHPAIDQISMFYLMRGPYMEGVTFMEQTANALRAVLSDRDADLALATTLANLAWLYLRIGRLGQARAGWEESSARYARLDEPPPPGMGTDPLLGLAMAALVEGRYHEAARLGADALRRAEATHHVGNLPYAWYMLTQAALAQGQEDAARHAAHQAVAAAELAGDRWFLAYCRMDLGVVAERAGNYAEASRHFQGSYALREEFGDPEGMAVALAHLGRVALRRGEQAQARALYKRSLILYEGLGDRGGLAAVMHGLGLAALADSDVTGASRDFREGLRLAWEIRFVPLILTVLAAVGELLHRIDRSEDAAEVLALVRHHASTERESSDRAQALLADLESLLPPDIFAAAVARGRSAEPEAIVARLDAALAARCEQSDLSSLARIDDPLPPPVVTQAARALPESITERELAVLRLIAAGRSNQQIADQLFLALSTVKWYVGNLFGKLQVRNRTEAVARARELRILA